MIAGVMGLLVSMLVLINGYAALRRPVQSLIQTDPIGRRLYEQRGEAFARRMYRVYGAACTLLGLLGLYLAVGLLRTG